MDHHLLKALQDLWAAAPRYKGGILSTPELARLIEACGPYTEGPAHYFGQQFAFFNALRSLGLPSQEDGEQASTDLEDVAAQLIDACTCTHRVRTHFCPLDLADDWPDLAFGNAVVRTFSPEELALELDMARLTEFHTGEGVDLERLSMVKWLVVKDPYPIQGSPARRSGSFMDQVLPKDWGAVKPHENGWPQAVEDAVFFLLLAPWEEWVAFPQENIFGFQIPWVYTVESDIFVPPLSPPIPDRLSIHWHLEVYPDGSEHEEQSPTKAHLHFKVQGKIALLNSDYWQNIENAKSTSLFATPVQHFLVRAFQAKGIDELLAHITAIEAAVGTQADYGRRTKYKELSASLRVAARLAGLLGDDCAAHEYDSLFDLRSKFLHGRAGIDTVSSTQRVAARRLARRAAFKLAERAANLPTSRDALLEQLLESGVDLVRRTHHGPPPPISSDQRLDSTSKKSAGAIEP